MNKGCCCCYLIESWQWSYINKYQLYIFHPMPNKLLQVFLINLSLFLLVSLAKFAATSAMPQYDVNWHPCLYFIVHCEHLSTHIFYCHFQHPLSAVEFIPNCVLLNVCNLAVKLIIFIIIIFYSWNQNLQLWSHQLPWPGV